MGFLFFILHTHRSVCLFTSTRVCLWGKRERGSCRESFPCTEFTFTGWIKPSCGGISEQTTRLIKKTFLWTRWTYILGASVCISDINWTQERDVMTVLSKVIAPSLSRVNASASLQDGFMCHSLWSSGHPIMCFIKCVRNAQGWQCSEVYFGTVGVWSVPTLRRFKARYRMTTPVPFPGCKG